MRPTVALLALVGLGCRAPAGGSSSPEAGRSSSPEAGGTADQGPALWHQACKRSALGQPDLDVVRCVGDYSRLPPFAANDLSRCTLAVDGSPTDEAVAACVAPDTQAYLEDAHRTQQALNTAKHHIEAFHHDHGRLPLRLDELDPAAETTDAWGRPFDYAVMERAYVLCSAGYDGESSTLDDLCAQRSVFFKF